VLGATTISGDGCGQLVGLLRAATEPVISRDGIKPHIFVTIQMMLEGQTEQE
jgi:hypothetical protein